MDPVPPVYFKWAQFDEYCSCGKRKAVFQRKFEIKVSEELFKGLSLSDARKEAIKLLGETKICCLRDLTHFPKNFICDTTSNALTDITIGRAKPVKENVRLGNNQSNVGWELLPKTKNVAGFDLDRYCMKLTTLSRSQFDKIAVLRHDGSSAIKPPAQFPGYKITRSQDFPSIESSISILTNEQLTLQFLNSNEDST